MKKYKISEGNFDKFLKFFGLAKAERPQTIDNLIQNDPTLKKLDKEMGDLNRKAADRIRNNPSFKEALKKAGFIPTGGW